MHKTKVGETAHQSSELVVRSPSPTAIVTSALERVVVTESPEQRIIDSVAIALAAKRCFSPTESLTFHNAVVTATAANSLAAQILPDAHCEQTSNSTIISGINIVVSQVAQLSKLYSSYAEVRDLQRKLYAAIPYAQVEQCSFTDATGTQIFATGELNATNIAAFVAQHGKAQLKMLDSDIVFTINYNGVFQKRALPILGMMLSTASTILFLCQSLSSEVDAVLRAQGNALYTAVGVVPNVPFISFAEALDQVFNNHKIAIYEACTQIARFQRASLSEETLLLMDTFVPESVMLENRKALRGLRDDVEARGTRQATLRG